jgi:lactoylglutathione lyase
MNSSIASLFEAHLPVADLDKAIGFYQNVVGLRLAHVTPERHAAFLWIGPPGNAMLGLWTAGASPQRTTLHIAFRASVDDVVAAPLALRAAGTTPLDFDGQPTDEPIVIAWMPAASIFFRDPDGHLLEYLAMLPDDARPELGVVSWRSWSRDHARKVLTTALASRFYPLRDVNDTTRMSRPPGSIR